MAEIHANGPHNHFETHARPWLRPIMRAIGLEPLGEWFSLSFWRFRPPKRADYENLALGVAGIVSEVDRALRDGHLGTHIRHVVFPELRESTSASARRM